MGNIEITKNSEADEKVDVTCRECKRSTKHLILSDVHSKYMCPGDDFRWDDEYQIVQCRGCETISFRKTHKNSNDYDDYDDYESEYTLNVNIYPNPKEGRDDLAIVFRTHKH